MADTINPSRQWSDSTKWFMGILSAIIIATVIKCSSGFIDKKQVIIDTKPIAIPFMMDGTRSFYSAKWQIRGTALVYPDKITINVESATVRNTAKAMINLLEIEANLMTADHGSTSGRIERSSPATPLNRPVGAEQMISIAPFQTTIPIAKNPVYERWLSFTCYESVFQPTTPKHVGLIPTGKGMTYVESDRQIFISIR